MEYSQLDVPSFFGITVESFNTISDLLVKAKLPPLEDLDDLKNRVEDDLLNKLKGKSYRIISADVQRNILKNAGAINYSSGSLSFTTRPHNLADVTAEAIMRTEELQTESHHAPTTAKRQKKTLKPAPIKESAKEVTKEMSDEESNESSQSMQEDSSSRVQVPLKSKLNVKEFDPSRCFSDGRNPQYSFEELKQFASQLPFLEFFPDTTYEALCQKISRQWTNWMIDRLKNLLIGGGSNNSSNNANSSSKKLCQTLSLAELEKLGRQYGIDPANFGDRNLICRSLTKKLIEFLLTLRAEEYGLGKDSREIVDMIMLGNFDITSEIITPNMRLIVLTMLARMNLDLLKYVSVEAPTEEMKRNVDLVLRSLQLIDVPEASGGISNKLVEELASGAIEQIEQEDQDKDQEQQELAILQNLNRNGVNPISTKVSQSKLVDNSNRSLGYELSKVRLASGDTFTILAKLIDHLKLSNDEFVNVRAILAPTDATLKFVIKQLNVTLEQLLESPDLKAIITNHLITNTRLEPNSPFKKRSSTTSPSGIKVDEAVVLENPVQINVIVNGKPHVVEIHGFEGFLVDAKQAENLSILKYKSTPQAETNVEPSARSAKSIKSVKKVSQTPIQVLEQLIKQLKDDDKDILKLSDFREGLSGVELNIQERDLIDKLFKVFDEYQEINPDFDPLTTASNIVDIIDRRIAPVKPKPKYESSTIDLGETKPQSSIFETLADFLDSPEGEGKYEYFKELYEDVEDDLAQILSELMNNENNQNNKNEIKIFLPTNSAFQEVFDKDGGDIADIISRNLALDLILSHISFTKNQPRDAKGFDIEMVYMNAKLRFNTSTLQGMSYENIQTTKNGTIYGLNGVLFYGNVAEQLDIEPIIELTSTSSEASPSKSESTESSESSELMKYLESHAEDYSLFKLLLVLLPNLLDINDQTTKEHSMTLFVPTNEAFEEANVTENDIIDNPSQYEHIAKLHVVLEKFTEQDLHDLVKDRDVPLLTAAGESVKLRLSKSAKSGLGYGDARVLNVRNLGNVTLVAIDRVITEGTKATESTRPTKSEKKPERPSSKGKEEIAQEYLSLDEFLSQGSYKGVRMMFDGVTTETLDGGDSNSSLIQFLEEQKAITVFITSDTVLANYYNVDVESLDNKVTEIMESEDTETSVKRLIKYVVLDAYQPSQMRELSTNPESTNKLTTLDGQTHRISHEGDQLLIDDKPVSFVAQINNGYVYSLGSTFEPQQETRGDDNRDEKNEEIQSSESSGEMEEVKIIPRRATVRSQPMQKIPTKVAQPLKPQASGPNPADEVKRKLAEMFSKKK